MFILSLFQAIPSLLLEVIIFLLIIFFYLFGHNIRAAILKKKPGYINKQLTAINGTLLGLLGLLLAFTFSMASNRYDARRQLIVEEANNISTVILRTDIYPDSISQLLKKELKVYVDARINFYKAGNNQEETIKFFLKADSVGKKIWTVAANFAKENNAVAKTSELIPAINAMIDITTTRREAGEANIPDSIMYLLLTLCYCSAFLLGYDNAEKVDWVIVTGFALMLSITIFTIIDLDRPRSGLINLDNTNRLMIELQHMFK